ncbi:MAG TPA: 6-phosphogluconolactonase [Gammaproteobacteria bacterium]|nr:6-phosphogluconolactonase [Gammaproteobacteria bacterium]
MQIDDDSLARSGIELHRHAEVGTMASALAAAVEAALVQALAVRGEASLAVPGGRTPLPLFSRLAQRDLDWARVHVTLTDERIVPVTDPLSNERLVREHLLQGAAAGARFHPLMNGHEDPEARAQAAWEQLAWLPRPFDAVVLGMGEDGHIAGLFPGVPSNTLDPAAAPGCVTTTAPVAPVERLSLNLAALLDARRLWLVLAGPAKLAVLVEALRPSPIKALPVRALLTQTVVPVRVEYAPG